MLERGSSKIRIVEIDNFRDFAALKDVWNIVLSESNHSVFSTWEWLSTWWKYYGDDKRMLILLAEENGKVVGIAPLMYSVYTNFGAKQGRIEFIGGAHSGYNDFILAAEPKKCTELFFDHLHGLAENWTFAKLSDVPEYGNCQKYLSRISNNMIPAHQCYYKPLPSSYDAFLDSLKGEYRKKFRRIVRRLEETGLKEHLVDYSSPSSVTEGMSILNSLHQYRWRVKGGFSGWFTDSNFSNFILEVAKYFSQKACLGLYVLELSGKPVASLCGFKYLSKYYAYISGLDSNYLRYNAGNLLFLRVMNKCIEDGLVEFDFLWGTDQYKRQWNPILKRTFDVLAFRKGFLNSWKYLIYTKYSKSGILLSNLLKEKAKIGNYQF